MGERPRRKGVLVPWSSTPAMEYHHTKVRRQEELSHCQRYPQRLFMGLLMAQEGSKNRKLISQFGEKRGGLI